MAHFHDELIARHEPWMTSDLLVYLEAVASLYGELDVFLGEEDDEPWEVLFDALRCPEKALPYLAQYVGERLPAGLTVAQQREWILDAPNSKRGTLRAIFLAAQRKLTGTRTVSWNERDNGTATDQPDHLVIHTYTPETPDPEGTFNDILSVAPADIEMHYAVLEGESWDDLDTATADWAEVNSDYANWTQVATTVVGLNSFSRPMP